MELFLSALLYVVVFIASFFSYQYWIAPREMGAITQKHAKVLIALVRFGLIFASIAAWKTQGAAVVMIFALATAISIAYKNPENHKSDLR